jgi:hypothetical protein
VIFFAKLNRNTASDEEAAVYMDGNEDIYVNNNQEHNSSHEMIAVQ